METFHRLNEQRKIEAKLQQNLANQSRKPIGDSYNNYQIMSQNTNAKSKSSALTEIDGILDDYEMIGQTMRGKGKFKDPASVDQAIDAWVEIIDEQLSQDV